MAERKLFTAAERFRVLERDGFRCVYCGKSAVDGACLSAAFHIDHVYPHSRGGGDEEVNLVTACLDCNLGKGDRVLDCIPPGVNASAGLQYFLQIAKDSGDIPILDRLPCWDRELLETLVFDQKLFCKYRSDFGAIDYESAIANEAIQIASECSEVSDSFTIDAIAFSASGVLCRCLVDIAASSRYRNRYMHDERERHLCYAFERRRESLLLDERLAACGDDYELEGKLLEEMVSSRRQAQGMED
jgi:hypothetical protein